MIFQKAIFVCRLSSPPPTTPSKKKKKRLHWLWRSSNARVKKGILQFLLPFYWIQYLLGILGTTVLNVSGREKWILLCGMGSTRYFSSKMKETKRKLLIDNYLIFFLCIFSFLDSFPSFLCGCFFSVIADQILITGTSFISFEWTVYSKININDTLYKLI